MKPKIESKRHLEGKKIVYINGNAAKIYYLKQKKMVWWRF